MYFLVIGAAAGVALPTLPAVSLFDDGTLSLWRDYARALGRERALAWDELDARKVAEDRLAELVTATNALASAQEAIHAQVTRIEGLEAALAQTQATAQAALHRAESALAQAEAVRAELAAARESLQQEREARTQTESALVREQAEHADTRGRLAYRESARGWLRFPLAVVRQRIASGR